MAVTYPHFDEQHMWRSGSSSPRNLSALVVHRRARPKPFSRQASRRLHSLLELRYAALAATWQSSTPTSHTQKGRLPTELERRAANQALDLAVNTSRDVERQVKARVQKRRSAMTWRGEQDLQASFVRLAVI